MDVSRGQFRLDVPSTVLLDINGGGTSWVGPANARETWHIASIAVTSTSTDIPTVRFYRNSTVPGNFVTGTFTGNLDVDSSPNLILRSGELLYAVWENGTAGATGTFRLEGTKVIV